MRTENARNARRELRVLAPVDSRPWSSSALSAATAVPWCCVVPAALASLGLASSVLGSWLAAGTPAFFLMSAGFLGRAHYLIWAKRHGSPNARITTLVLTAAVVWTWALRLAPWLPSWR